jgi:hypothetical protein
MSGTNAHDDDDIDEHISAKWTNVESAFRWDGSKLRGSSTKKTVATTGNTVGSLGVTTASLATGTQSLAVAGAIIAGGVVSATGVGLVVAGAALTLASIATNATSMVKSASHVTQLKRIRGDLGSYRKCVCMTKKLSGEMAHDHEWIATKVLPYIISQKTEKAVKKGVGIVPGVSLMTNIYRLGRFVFKKDRGKKRGYYAYVLTRHLITHDCMLAGAIVSQLFSAREMLVLRMHCSDDSSPIIGSKMKSV